MLNGENELARQYFREAKELFSPEFDFMKKSCAYFEGHTYYVYNDWAKVRLAI